MNVPARGGGFRAQADAVGNEADNDEIRRQLVRIVGSAPLIGSLRLTRFLTFVVKATLAGEGARIKAYTIAVEALGRGSDFDPQADPIVRVEAGRLRTALARYYADAGRDDPVTIELPRGSYVPTFRRPEPNKPQVPAPTKIDQSPTVDHASRWSVLVERRRESERLRGAVERQFVELHAEMRATRVALKDSQALLGQQSDRGVARPAPAPTLPPLSQAAETPADPVNVEQVAAPALPRLPEPSHAVAIKSGIRAVKNAAKDCKRRHPRIFRYAVYAAYAVCLLAILEVVFDIDHPLHGGPNNGLFFKWSAAADTTAGQWTHGEAAPVIYVEPPTLLGQTTATALSAAMIHDQLIDVLARFDDVTVVGNPPPDGPTRAVPRASESGPAPPSHYRLATTAQYGSGDATRDGAPDRYRRQHNRVVEDLRRQKRPRCELGKEALSLATSGDRCCSRSASSRRASASNAPLPAICRTLTAAFSMPMPICAISIRRNIRRSKIVSPTQARKSRPPSASSSTSRACICATIGSGSSGNRATTPCSIARRKWPGTPSSSSPTARSPQYALQDVLLAQGDLVAREGGRRPIAAPQSL